MTEPRQLNDAEIVAALYRHIYGAPLESRMGWDPLTQEAHAWECVDYLVAGDVEKAVKLSSAIRAAIGPLVLSQFFLLSTEARLRALTMGCARLAGVL